MKIKGKNTASVPALSNIVGPSYGASSTTTFFSLLVVSGPKYLKYLVSGPDYLE